MNDERDKRITIAHILTHLSGIPDVKDYEWNNPRYDDESFELSCKLNVLSFATAYFSSTHCWQ